MKDKTEVGQEDGKEVDGEYGHHHELQVVGDDVGLPGETVACVLNINKQEQFNSRWEGGKGEVLSFFTSRWAILFHLKLFCPSALVLSTYVGYLRCLRQPWVL